MSGVVIRCTHCGTTQGELGECEACHEGDTRYYCPNHSPGMWLDASACAACGARVGVPGRSERPAPPPRPAAPAPGRPPLPPREFPPPVIRRGPPPGDRELTPEPDAEWPTPVEAHLRDMLEEMARAGLPRRPDLETSLPPIGATLSTAFGCVRRLVLVAVFLAILAMIAFYYLFGVGGVLN